MKPLVLLHGALGSSAQFAELSSMLEGSYQIHTVDFSGHGGSTMAGNFSIHLFVNDVLRYMDDHELATSDFFGYSMGGYVALKLASLDSGRVRKIITLATKFDWTPESASKEAGMLDPEKIAQKVPPFAQILEERHQPSDWKTVVGKTADMMIDMGNKPPLDDGALRSIGAPVLLCRGDQDTMVSDHETRHAADLIPNSKLATIAGSQHALEKTDVGKLAQLIKDFISDGSEI